MFAAGLAVAVGLFACVAVGRAGVTARSLVPMLILLGSALSAGRTALTVRAVEDAWPKTRSKSMDAAEARFQRDVSRAVEHAQRLVERAGAFETESRSLAFESIDRAVGPRATDHGVVIFDSDGLPWAWGGALREPPGPIGPTLTARMVAFYVFLEARRQDERRTVVSQVILAADSAVPDRGPTFAAQFTARTGVGLLFRNSMPEAGVPAAVFCINSCVPEGAMPVDTLLIAELIPPSQGSAKLNALVRGGRWTVMLAMVGLVWMVVLGGSLGRWVGFLGVIALLLVTPAGGLLGFERFFSSASYFLATFGPFSASAGALFLSALLIVVVLLQQIKRWRPLGISGKIVSLGVIAVAPWVMAFLAAGITPLSTGTTAMQWLSWQVTLAVAGVGLGLVAGKLWGRSTLPMWWAPALGSASALGLAAYGVATWQPFEGWPPWYPLLWMPVAWLAVQGVTRARVVVGATIVAGAAASVLTWNVELDARLVVADRDANRLSTGDPVAISALGWFGDSLSVRAVPRVSAALYAQWSRSILAEDDYPAVLDSWDPFGQRIASLELAELPIASSRRERLAARARATGQPVYEPLKLEYGVHYMAAIPFPDRSVVTVAVGPRSRLIPPVLVARFLRGEQRINAPYDLTLGEAATGFGSSRTDWGRTGASISGRRILDVTGRARHLIISVPIPEMADLVVRGVLVVLVDGLVLLLIVALSAGVLYGFGVSPALREGLQLRSYRVRLAIALGGFFVLPTLGFAIWSLGGIRSDADRSRDLLIQGSLSEATLIARQTRDLGIPGVQLNLAELGGRLGTDLLLYERGVLSELSAPVLRELGLVGQFLPPDVYRELELRDRLEMNVNTLVGARVTRVGYLAVDPELPAAPILAAPQLVDASDLQHEREDLALGVLLVAILGVTGAIGLAAMASRSLAKPVQSLRTAAIAVGRGDPLPAFDPGVPTEFVPVVDAFVRMAHDIERSQTALEVARRRTATVLANVATGVVAVDSELRVMIANPRAAELLGSALPSGDTITDIATVQWRPVWEWVRDFMESGEEFAEEEFAVGDREIRAQVAAMLADPRGCVVALDDTTELSKAVRVLAWGELARQVAHEIKNPLTPIRLGIQHIQRARRDGSAEFDSTLERTSRHILAEIERLDSIARAFARFGAPPAETAPLELNDVVGIAGEAADLYAVGDGPEIRVEAAPNVQARVRRDEVKEVLINLVENARDAQASLVVISIQRYTDAEVTIQVQDNGSGITKEHMRRVFEPRFSTTSSGTGLGLAICRRLVEGWGGTISVRSTVGEGTEVTMFLKTTEEAPEGI